MKGSSKFIKGHCKKTNQYFGLEIKQFSGQWKVVNMTKLNDSEAMLISSEVKQPVFETNSNLLACSKCGNRKVGGCSCAKHMLQCSSKMNYQFQCIYCNEMEVDYSLPHRADVGGRAGETIKLSQGQEVKIKFADDKPLKKIIVGVGWDPVFLGKQMDVDSSVVLLSSSTGRYDTIYYGNLNHPSGCIIHHGDNLTGVDRGANDDDENISVYLDKVPYDKDKIVFILNIYKAYERNQTLRSVRNLYIRLYDPDTKRALIEYKVNTNMTNETGVVIGMAFKKGQEWNFKAIGKPHRVENIAELERKLSEYC